MLITHSEHLSANLKNSSPAGDSPDSVASYAFSTALLPHGETLTRFPTMQSPTGGGGQGEAKPPGKEGGGRSPPFLVRSC